MGDPSTPLPSDHAYGVFGVPLSRAAASGSLIPEPVDQMLYVLGCCVPAQADLFDLSVTEPKVVALKGMFDAGSESPLAQEDNPQVIASLLVLYLRSLPQPIIPPKFFFTVMRLCAIPSPWPRLRQLRVLVNKLPAVCRAMTTRLLTFLNATSIDKNRLASLFAKYFLRPTLEYTEAPIPLQAVRIVADLIEHAAYISLVTSEPVITDPSAIPEPPNEFKLLGYALYDFQANDGVLSLHQGDKILIVNIHPDDWIEGTLNGFTGFIPAGYLDILPLNPPSGRGRGSGVVQGAPPVPTSTPQVKVMPSPTIVPNAQPNPPSPLQTAAPHPDSPEVHPIAPQVNSELSQQHPAVTQPVAHPAQPPLQPATQPVQPYQPVQPTTPAAVQPVQPVQPALSMQLPPAPRPPPDESKLRASNNASPTPSGPAIQEQQATPSPPRPSPLQDDSSYESPPVVTNTNTNTNTNTVKPPPVTQPPKPTPSGREQAQGGSDEMKVVVVGGGGVGKSALTICFVQNNFVETYDPTIEDSYRKQVVVDDRVCILNILDTAGQEEYSALRDQYMHQGQGFVLVFSLTARTTFQEIPALYKHILQVKDAPQVPLVLVGNKSDLVSHYKVSAQEAADLAREFGVPYVMTSAKLHNNVDETFFTLIREVRKCTFGQGTEAVNKKKKKCIFL